MGGQQQSAFIGGADKSAPGSGQETRFAQIGPRLTNTIGENGLTAGGKGLGAFGLRELIGLR